MAVEQHLVGRKDQPECLLLAVALEFGESELVEWQQQAVFSRYFDSDCASVRVARPAFG